jgi:Protein of unknown function (DUF2510)
VLSETQPADGWYPDPLGRHDLRYWQSGGWSDHVVDAGAAGRDPIEGVSPHPVTIRPSWPKYRDSMRSLAAWRWAVTLVALALLALLAFEWGGWLAVVALIALLVWCWAVLMPLYFKLTYIRAGSEGIEMRNLLGIRRTVPRDRIASVAVGKAWMGGLRIPDLAFIVSPSGGRIARMTFMYWELDDLRRLANAVGLPLYGRPGRTLDKFHSAKAVERIAQVYGISLVAGIVTGIVVPVALLAGLIGWAILTAHH